MYRFYGMGLIGLSLMIQMPQAMPQAVGQAPTSDVTVRVVKYDGLAEEVAKHRGEVVLVDFWGTFCIPCIKAFPHQVQLSRKYQKDGLVVISVSVDKLKDQQGKPIQEEVEKKVRARLVNLSATFPNLILDESQDVLKDKLGIELVPCLFVFNRQGQWTRFGGKNEGGNPLIFDEISGGYPAVDTLIQQYLKQ